MKTRVLSGIVLAIIMISSSFCGGWYLYLLCAGVSLIGMYELYRVIDIQKECIGMHGISFGHIFITYVFLQDMKI